MKSYWLIFATLIALGFFLRVYNFEKRVIYGPEQGISLATSASNLSHFSLLGETNLIRKTSSGHIPFPDATYSYLLLPFLVLFRFDPLPVTFLFTLLNLLTGALLALVVKKPLGKETSLLTLFFFMFSAPMIHHSLFTWIVNPVPLLSVLTMFFGYKLFIDRDNWRYPLYLGILSGLGFGMQKMYLVYLVFVFLGSIYFSKNKVKTMVLFITGVMLGNLPTIAFDLRHQFYHLKTFTEYFWDIIAGSANGSTSYYNYLYLYPIFFTSLAFIGAKIFKFSSVVAMGLGLIFLFKNMASPMINLDRSTGMVKNITLDALKIAAETIAKDKPPEKFNVVTLWDFDTRAYTERYLLTYMYKLTPSAVENYKDNEVVYALAPLDYDIIKPKVWELQEFLPYKVSVLPDFAEGYKLYKLSK